VDKLNEFSLGIMTIDTALLLIFLQQSFRQAANSSSRKQIFKIEWESG